MFTFKQNLILFFILALFLDTENMNGFCFVFFSLLISASANYCFHYHSFYGLFSQLYVSSFVLIVQSKKELLV